MARPIRIRLLLLLAAAAAVSSCSSARVDIGEVPPLPESSPAQIEALLASSDVPVVVNVWASWCSPCRSEAALLRTAAAEAGGSIRFVGIDVRDDQDGARGFIAEFGLTGFEHYFDPTGAIPAALGGTGVPVTFFFAPGGEIFATHFGVIDEQTLALQVDELLAGQR